VAPALVVQQARRRKRRFGRTRWMRRTENPTRNPNKGNDQAQSFSTKKRKLPFLKSGIEKL
jgi:hypothetical protein